MPSRDLTFDLLRGGAVLYIVGYYHIQDVWLAHLPGPLAGWLARIALALFCFLSGYLLSANTRTSDWKSVGNFYRRRLLKIYPLYLLALVFFVRLDLCPAALFWPSALLVNTLLDWSLLTLWFISMIFLFYLLTPLYLHRSSIGKTCVLTVLLMLAMLAAKLSWHIIDPRLFPNLAAFAFGILLTQSLRLRDAFFHPQLTMKIVSLLPLLTLGCTLSNIAPLDSEPTHMALVLAWFLAALPWLMIGARWLTQFLPARAIDFLATASFVLYLSHRIIYHLGEKFFALSSPWLRQFYYLLVLLPVALVVSHALQRAYQRLVK